MLDRDYAPQAKQDLTALGARDRELLIVVLRWIERLRSEPLQHGVGLFYRSGQPASLERCRKLWVGPNDDPTRTPPYRGTTPGGPPLRIVYELQPDETKPQRIFVWAVGPKPEVYDDAAARRAANLLE